MTFTFFLPFWSLLLIFLIVGLIAGVVIGITIASVGR